MKKHISLISFLLAVLFTVHAQDGSQLTLKRIFADKEFQSDWFGPSRWIDGGDGYTTLEKSKEYHSFLEIVRYETASGNREVLVNAAMLIPNGETAPLHIENYNWSFDKSKLLIYTNSKRVWRKNTKGDYWVLDLKVGNLQKLGGNNAKPSTLMFAKFSPDGERVGYVREHNIYVENLRNGKIIALTTNGTKEIINGTFDWVYEEEFGCQDGFKWSPDGSKIAYWQLDAHGLGVFNMINNTDSIYSKIIPIQYPKVGEINSACRVGVVSANGGETIWMKVSGDPRNNYIPRMQWSASSIEIAMQYTNRKQNHYQVLTANAVTGQVNAIYEDKDQAWIEVTNDWQYLNKGESFTWVSEKNGWKSIYKIKRDGSKEELISSGTFDIVNISLIDEVGGYLYYRASPNNATQRYLYRSRLTGKIKPKKITPGAFSGTNNYNISPNAKWAIHTFSKAGVPPKTTLISLPNHKLVRVLVANTVLKDKVEKINKNKTEFFSVNAADGTSLDCSMIKPVGFDPNKKYPVFFYVYGEPWGQTVLDAWGWNTYLYHLYLTQNGYIVMSVDNRGTPAPKGRQWRKSVHGQIGVKSSADQADATQAIIQKFPFVDKNRVGIWGWSGGGSMTLNMMFRYPEIYKTGISVAPVPDQTLYDNIYQERYSGLLTENAEGYKQGSPITHAKNLQGNLMIIHGTGDDNVHYQGTERLINELVKHNKIFSLMSYPNRSHGIWEGEGTSLHLYETMFKYINTNLEPGGKSVTFGTKK